MKVYNFDKLTPSEKVDLNIYNDAFSYIFENNDICNVAISGPYSSGKSSLLKSYEVTNGFKFLYLSLAHFEQQGDAGNGLGNEKGQVKYSSKSIIEGKLINQLVQKIDPQKVPKTYFKTKSDEGFDNKTTQKIAVYLCLIILCMLYFACNSFLQSRDFFVPLTCDFTYCCFMFATIILCYGAIYKLINYYNNTVKISKISIQGNEIEILEENNDSFFDKYLNEVLYLFENITEEVIVFEDIDRFGYVEIFERLREINQLVNVRKKRKEGENYKPLRFLYLLRDDMFLSKDRTKFFDFIIPVIPVIDSSNSFNKIKENLEKNNLFEKFDEKFLREISIYVDDFRILKNICNEFKIYYGILNIIGQKIEKMFAMIVYKNLFPKDFAELQQNKGYVYSVFNNREEFLKNEIIALEKEIEKLENRIKNCQDECLEDKSELDTIAVKKKPTYYHQSYGGNAEQDKIYDEWYDRRKLAITDKLDKNLFSLNRELDMKKEELENIRYGNMCDLITDDNETKIFKELASEDYKDIIENHYFQLLCFLIKNGYIDEAYSDFMTRFYDNSLSINDKKFIRRMYDGGVEKFDYKLNDAALVMEYVSLAQIQRKECLNFDLLAELLNNKEKYGEYLKSFVGYLRKNKRFDFVFGFIKQDKNTKVFVENVIKIWPEIFIEVLAKDEIEDDILVVFTKYSLILANEDTLAMLNQENKLKMFIEKHPCYLDCAYGEEDKLLNSIKKLGVKFELIDNTKTTPSMYRFVYENNLYEFNEKNVLMFLHSEYKVKKDSNLRKNLLSLIYSKQDAPLWKYTKSNFEKNTNLLLDISEDIISDNEQTVLMVLNDDNISEMTKIEYINRLNTKIHDIKNINETKIKGAVIEALAADITVDNVLEYYYISNKNINAKLINFINEKNGHVGFGEYEQFIEPDDKKFVEDVLKVNELTDAAYKEIVEFHMLPNKQFTVRGVSESHFKILIKMNKIIMNRSNLLFVRANYNMHILDFIRENITEYFELPVEANVVCIKDMAEILCWSEISDETKLKQLLRINEKISVDGKQYSVEIMNQILKNYYCEEDLGYLCRNYSSFHESTKDIIYGIVFKNISKILDIITDIDEQLLECLFSDKSVTVGIKIKFLEKLISNIEKEQLIKLLSDEEFIEIRRALGHKKNATVTVNTVNEKLLNAMQGYFIKSYKVSDGKYSLLL